MSSGRHDHMFGIILLTGNVNELINETFQSNLLSTQNAFVYKIYLL